MSRKDQNLPGRLTVRRRRTLSLTPRYTARVGLQNFRTFVRVCIDANTFVNGNDWLYSRESYYVAWHSAVSVKDDGMGHRIRDDSDKTHNLIGGGDDISIQPPT